MRYSFIPSSDDARCPAPASGEPIRCGRPIAFGATPRLHVGHCVLLLILVTAIAGVSFFALAAPDAIASTVLGDLMIVGATVDARSHRLPNAVTYAAILAGLAFAMLSHSFAFWDAQTAGLRGAGTALLFLGLRCSYAYLRGRQGLGLGDVKLAAAIGVWLPFEQIPLCLTLASSLALITVLFSRYRGGQPTRTTKIPLGIFLCPALWLTFFVTAAGAF